MNLPASERSAQAHKGSTTPRVYTPPLPTNCDTAAGRQCDCGCGLHPETSWGFACIDFLEKVLRWSLLRYQRWLYIHALEKAPDGIAYRFETILLLIARQNGKTQWLKGLGLWRLYVDGAKQVLVSAQTLEMAETTLAEAVADVKASPLLRKEFRRFSQTNGKFKLILKPTPGDPFEEPREWRAAVASRRGGRSLSADLAMLDELREHQNWLAWNAIVPTTTARPRALVVAASNAGDATSVVLRSLRDGATARILSRETEQTRVFLAEWSVPDDVDPLDPTYWPLANPAQGYLFTEDALRGKSEALHDNVPGWRTEHLCQWVEAIEPGIFPQSDWRATTDPNSRHKADAPVFASLDINFHRSQGYVAVAARRDDGDLHIEIAHAERGTDWIVPWFSERTDRFRSVVIQTRGAPASGLIDELRAAGVPVFELGGTNLTHAYGYAYDLTVEHKWWHRPSPALDEAAHSAQARILGDSWVIDRKKSPTDASPLVACVQAAAGEMLYQPKRISAYENSDLLVI